MSSTSARRCTPRASLVVSTHVAIIQIVDLPQQYLLRVHSCIQTAQIQQLPSLPKVESNNLEDPRRRWNIFRMPRSIRDQTLLLTSPSVLSISSIFPSAWMKTSSSFSSAQHSSLIKPRRIRSLKVRLQRICLRLRRPS
jgi:hypothetical protein